MTETQQSNADALVAAWIVRRYRANLNRTDEHLRDCPDVTATGVDASDGTYGCDTGCEYYRLEATISCPHGFSDEFEYGDFGELAWIIEDLEKGREPW